MVSLLVWTGIGYTCPNQPNIRFIFDATFVFIVLQDARPNYTVTEKVFNDSVTLHVDCATAEMLNWLIHYEFDMIYELIF